MQEPDPLFEHLTTRDKEVHSSILPSGIVTFLFTDIVGSTPLWEKIPAEMSASIALHHAILRRGIEANQGLVCQIIGDAFQSVFRLATQALTAAIQIQHDIQSAAWGATGPIQVRMGLHTGPAEPDPNQDAPYRVSHTLNRAARIMAAGYGGQILLSQEAANLVERELAGPGPLAGVRLLDLGEQRMKGMQRPEHVFQVCADGLPASFPPLSTSIQTPNNLPTQLTSFIGRENEMEQVVELLGQHRLITLTGSGGTGKTRMALRVAETVLERFPAGAWFVDLAPVTSADRLPQTVAKALGLQESLELPVRETLINYLKKRRLLIVLDNCEHLVEGCAALVDELLQACLSLSFLATSREALRVSGEYTYYVPSLSVPDANDLLPLEELHDFEAVRLFTERAAASRTGFHLTVQNATTVVRICRRLDGIPLAIELAAARVRVMSVEQIHSRLEQSLRLLSGGPRTAFPRQQTLNNLIDWSYNLLTQPECLLLMRLSVFVGGWTLEAAEAVCGFNGIEDFEVLDLIQSLVEKSLVTVSVEESDVWNNIIPGNGARYRMLETIRQYARERLVEASPVALDEIRSRHLDYFERLARRAGPRMRGKDQMAWIQCVNDELENMRAALDWATHCDIIENVTAGLEIMRSLELFLYFFGHGKEMLARVETGLACLQRQAAIPRLLLARAYFTAASMAFAVSKLQNAIDYTEKSIALLRPEGPSADLSGSLGYLAFLLNFTDGDLRHALALINEASDMNKSLSHQTESQEQKVWVNLFFDQANLLFAKGILYMHVDVQQARAFLQESLAIFKESGNMLYATNPARILGAIAMMEGDFDQARDYLQPSLSTNRKFSAKTQIVWDLSALGDLAYFEGQFEQMLVYFDDCLETAEECSFLRPMVWSQHHRGVAARRLGRLEQASHWFHEGYSQAKAYGFVDLMLENLAGLAGIALDRDQTAEAVKGLAASSRQGLDIFDPISQAEFTRDEAEARKRLPEQEFRSAWEEGRSTTEEQVKQSLHEA